MTGFIYTSRNNETVADLRAPTGNASIDTAIIGAVEAAKAAMKVTCAEYLRQLSAALSDMGTKVDRVVLPVYHGTSSGETAFRANLMAKTPFRVVSLTGNDKRPLPSNVMPPAPERTERPATVAKPERPVRKVRGPSPLGNKTKPDSKAKSAARKAERRARDQAMRSQMRGSSNKKD